MAWEVRGKGQFGRNAALRRWWLLLPVLAAGCGPDHVPGTIYPPDSEVPVRFALAHGLFIDSTPVRTDLYPYSSPPPGQAQRYITTGPPLSFVFPRSAYAAYENAAGGPQALIRLRIDRETLRPIGSLLAKNPGTEPDWVWRRYRALFHDRDLSIDIRGDAVSPGNFADLPSNVKGVYADRPAGRACELSFHHTPVTSTTRSYPPLVIGDVDLMNGDYEAVADPPATSRVRCVATSRICRVSFGFAGREVDYAMPKHALCGHRAETQRIARLLSRYRIL